MRMLLSSIIMAVAMTLASSGLCLGETGISESDQRAINGVLERLTRAMVEEDIKSIRGLFSPNMDKEKRREIKQVLKQRFRSHDYQKYQFDMPLRTKIKVLEPGKKVEFRVRYSEEYKFKTSGSGSSSGLSSRFTMEKVGGKWLILDTDFYSKENIMKWMGVLGLIFALFVLVIILSIPFWIWMLIDCIRRDFSKPNEKVAWVIVIVFTQIIGAIVYYIIVKRKTAQSKQ